MIKSYICLYQIHIMKPYTFNPGHLAKVRHTIAESFCRIIAKVQQLTQSDYIPIKVDICDDDTAIAIKAIGVPKDVLQNHFGTIVPNSEYSINGDGRLVMKISLI